MNKNTPEKTPCTEALSPEELSRRRFFERISIVLSSLCAVALAVPGIGFVLAPFTRKVPRLWRKVGHVDDFKVGETTSVTLLDSSPLPWAGVTAKTAAWLRRTSKDEFIAFAVNCSHLGCPVRWLANANLFMCPCHGGVYYADGSVAAGPPPRPLTRYQVRVRDGQVELQTRPIPIA